MKTRLLGFAALVALIGVVAGVPWLLLRWGADLTPDQLTLADVLDVLLRPDDGTVALVAITVIAWIAWAVIAHLRRGGAGRGVARGDRAPAARVSAGRSGVPISSSPPRRCCSPPHPSRPPPARPPHRRRRPRRSRLPATASAGPAGSG